jgi:hypothetical protein
MVYRFFFLPPPSRPLSLTAVYEALDFSLHENKQTHSLFGAG